MSEMSERKKRDVVNLQNYYLNGKLQPCSLAEDIVFESSGENKGIYVLKDNDDIIVWTGKQYTIDKRGKLIKGMAQQLLGNIARINSRNEVVECVRNTKEIWIDRSELNKDVNLINLRNGTYNIATGEFTAHDKKNIITNYLDIEYNPKADCPKIKKFMSEIHYPEDILGIQEWFGYNLYREYPFHKFIIGLGEGENGKSVELNLLSKFLGKENTVALSMLKIAEVPHQICELDGKLANIYPDIKDKDINYMDIIKSLTCGDAITDDRKFGHPYTFISYAKLSFSCNILPRIREDTRAVWRRCQPINYPNKFEGKNADKNLLKKLTTDDELSGLFNWSIEGLKRLLENEEFSFKIKDVEDIREYYKTKTEPIYVFTQKFLYYDANSKLTMGEVYERYENFVDVEKLEKTSQSKFGRELKNYFPMLDKKTIKIEGRSYKFYIGLAWQNNSSVNVPQSVPIDKQQQLFSDVEITQEEYERGARHD